MNLRVEKGFTLIEVIVALILVSFIMTTIVSAALAIKGKRQRTEERDHAILLAASLIAAQRLRPAGYATLEGKEGRLHWQVVESELARDPRGFFVLDRIEAKLLDREGRFVFSASTRKLKPLMTN